MVGAVFTSGPAALLASISPLPLMAWSAIIFIYYICATILPINVLIGRIYPFFAALLIFMAVSLTVALFAEGYPILPHVTMDSFFHSTHPQGTGYLARPLHRYRLRRYFRLPRHAVSHDGALHDQ